MVTAVAASAGPKTLGKRQPREGLLDVDNLHGRIARKQPARDELTVIRVAPTPASEHSRA